MLHLRRFPSSINLFISFRILYLENILHIYFYYARSYYSEYLFLGIFFISFLFAIIPNPQAGFVAKLFILFSIFFLSSNKTFYESMSFMQTMYATNQNTQNEQQQRHCFSYGLPSNSDVASIMQQLHGHGFTNHEISIILANYILRDQTTYNVVPLRKRETEDCYYPGLVPREPCDSSKPIIWYNFLDHTVVFISDRDQVKKIIRGKK